MERDDLWPVSLTEKEVCGSMFKATERLNINLRMSPQGLPQLPNSLSPGWVHRTLWKDEVLADAFGASREPGPYHHQLPEGRESLGSPFCVPCSPNTMSTPTFPHLHPPPETKQENRGGQSLSNRPWELTRLLQKQGDLALTCPRWTSKLRGSAGDNVA